MSNTSTMLFSIYEIDGVTEIDNYKSNKNIFITPFSITHFGFGYMTQAFGINYFYGLVLHTIYEFYNYKSYTLQKKWSEDWKGFVSDSMLNGVGDTLFFMIGMFVSKNYNNLYLFIFIFLMIFLFYSPYFQSYFTKRRLEYLKSKDSSSKLKKLTLSSPTYTFNFFIIWIILSLLTFIKLKISNKNFKF
jgi:hypothetical protein